MSKLQLLKGDANDRLKATGSAEPAGWERVDLRQGRHDVEMFEEPLSQLELNRGSPKRDKQGNIVEPGKVKATMANAIRILTEMGPWAYDEAIPHFRLNQRSQRIVCARDWPIIGPRGRENEAYHKDAPWDFDREDRLVLAYYLSRITGADFTTEMATAAIEYCAYKSQFDPVEDYLRGLHWDGKPRLSGMLAKYFRAEDTVWHSTAGRKWMISAVARALRPGCQVDSALVIEGKGGNGKTSGMRILASAKWHSDSCPPLGTDASMQFLLGKWIVEIGELDSLRKSDANASKRFLSAIADDIRKPYAADWINVPRRCVFVGTTNDKHYLADVTGNRRFWPVRTKKEDALLDELHGDRDQLWAEAVAEFVAGEQWWLDKREAEIHETEAENRLHDSPLTDRIQEILAGYADGASVRICDISERLGVRIEQERKMTFQISEAMTTLGWKSIQRKVDGKNARYWVRDV